MSYMSLDVHSSRDNSKKRYAYRVRDVLARHSILSDHGAHDSLSVILIVP